MRRAALAGVTLRLSLLGFLVSASACQDELAAPRAQASEEPRAASARVEAVRGQFAVYAENPLLERRVASPFLRPNEADASSFEGDRWVPTPRAIPAGSTARRAKVRLPPHAAAAFSVTDESSGMTIHVRALDAVPSEREIAEAGTALYRGAIGGADWIHRAFAEGVEDYAFFEERPAVEALRFSVELPADARVRSVAGGVEFLDARGTPRLRMAPPAALDATGASLPMTTRVEGCRVDRDGRPPWGRAIPPAGETCVITVGWSGGRYPVLVDPAWTTTGSLAIARREHTATTLSSGKVIVLGGEGLAGVLDTPEVFDPATETWALGAPTGFAARLATATLLAKDGSRECILFAGGNSAKLSTLDTGVRRDDGLLHCVDATGAAENLLVPGTMSTDRAAHTATLLASGEVLVAGGTSVDTVNGQSVTQRHPNVDFFLPPTQAQPAGSWATQLPGIVAVGRMDRMTRGRAAQVAVRLPSGRVLVASGLTDNSNDTTPTAELFRAGNGATPWTPTATSMTQGRYFPVAFALPSGEALVAGGAGGQDVFSSVEIYDEKTDKWTLGAPLSTPRLLAAQASTNATAGDGAVRFRGIVSGGVSPPATVLMSNEVYDDRLRAWLPAGSLSSPRTNHTLATLLDGRVLSAGGTSLGANLAPVATTELLGLPVAAACGAAPGACLFGCVDGVCCDTVCDGDCMGCSQAVTGKPDGVCAPVKVATDPHDDCLDQGAASGGGRNGVCDGLGACQTYQQGQLGKPCSSGASCATGNCVDGVCCQDACTGACQACSAAAKGSGLDGVCAPIAAGRDDANECPPGGQGACAGEFVCNGSGACRAASAGKMLEAGSCVSDAVQRNPSACDEAGVPQSQGDKACVAYSCRSGACGIACATANECLPSFACVDGACVKAFVDGAACKVTADCKSGFCVDGVCCNNACDGPCSSCNGNTNQSGVDGTCGPVKEGTDPRNRCEEATGVEGRCLQDGLCGADGACRTTRPAGQACGPTQCAGTSREASACDGFGVCAKQTVSCADYACDAAAGACKTTCSTDADCAAGRQCDVAKKACAPQASACVDATSVRNAAGLVERCPAGFACSTASGQCHTVCSTNVECDTASGYRCANARCVLSGTGGAAGSGGAAGTAGSGGVKITPVAEDDGGCGCTLPGAASSGGVPAAAWLVAAQVVVMGARRRRSPRGAR